MAEGYTDRTWCKIEAYATDGRGIVAGDRNADISKSETVWGRSMIDAIVQARDCGDYTVDCERGRALAASLIRQMTEADFTPMLGTVCRGIIEAGSWKSIHAGFFQCLAERCVAAPN